MGRRKQLTVAVIGLALGLTLVPAAAFGQGSTWEGQGLQRTLDTALWKSGILRANAALELRDAGYDSDIFYGYFGTTVPDYIFSASAPVQLLFSLSKTIVLDLYDSPRYDFYLQTKTERAWNNTFRGQVHVALSKVYLRLGGEIGDNRRRLSQELYANIREKTKSLDAYTLWQLSRTTSLALFYDRELFNYGNADFPGWSLAEMLNRTVDSLEFVTFFQSDRRFRIFLDGQYGNYVFDAAVSQYKNTHSYAVYGGFFSVLGDDAGTRVGRVEGSGRLGYMKFNVLDSRQPDGSGLVGDVDVNVGILKLTDARLFYSKGFEFSIFAGATFFMEDNYGGGLVHWFSRRTSLAYTLTFGRSSYPGSTISGDPLAGVEYRFTTNQLSLNKILSQTMRLSVSGSWGQRKTSETDQVWNRYVIGVSLEFGTPTAQVSAPIAELLRSPGFGR